MRWKDRPGPEADLVYAITKSLWQERTTQLLDKLDPIGNRLRLDRALSGLSVPLHPGAARFYREVGMRVDSTPQPTVEPVEKKGP